MPDQLLWNQIKETLQNNFSQAKLLHSVLEACSLESRLQKGQKYFQLKVPSSFHQNILQNHLSHIQDQILSHGLLCPEITVTKALTPLILPKKALPPSQRSKPVSSKPSSFSSEWTFSSFVEGPNSCFAFSLARSIAAEPRKNSSNPLFLYGPSGFGKTHLLHAIGNALEKRSRFLKVRYLPAERFFNDCISHIRKNEMSVFRKKYRENLEVLLLDDVQILGKGVSIQEEFFHTFESLKQAGCQIVLASDQKPRDIRGLKQRIKTRFEGGVVADIGTPDKDTKTAIIKSKAEKLKLSVSEDIISFISKIPSQSIREIEGHLKRIKMFCELQNKKPGLNLIKELFPGSKLNLESSAIPTGSSSDSVQTLRVLTKEVCKRFMIKTEELKSKSRLKHLVQARGLLVYLGRRELELSLSELGSFLGNRNHSTILNSFKKVEKQIQAHPKLAKDIKDLQNFIHKPVFKNVENPWI